ncbi:MAG: GerMN domain-containing protein [Acidimicrobiales bacterium]|nr:GerMN domain-containing protein [Acidimicrobiales bacterium]
MPSLQPPARRPGRLALALALGAALLAGSLVGCGSDGGDTAGSSTSTSAPAPATTVTTATPSGPATTAAGDTTEARVYFARDEAVATAGRTVATPAVARGALDALLEGPTADEAGIGMTSEIPEATELLGVDVADGTATVDLSAAFESGGGSLSMQLRVAQVVFTLTQFPTVDEVDVHLDGDAVEAIGGEGVPADGLTRADFENVTPLILVEAPVPGATVSSPVELSGTANTFEANVRYTITGADGTVLADGFTTATAGTGTWGTFSVEVDLEGRPTGTGTVTAFEESAEDGSAVNEYDVPVRFG